MYQKRKMKFYNVIFVLIFTTVAHVVFASGKDGKNSSGDKPNKSVPTIDKIRFDEDLNDSVKIILLKKSLDKTLANKIYNRTQFGIHIQYEDGETIYEKNSDKTFIPASTLKIITTATALNKLGPNYFYRTDVSTDGEISDGIVEGNIIIHGTADPKLSGYFDAEIDQIVKSWVDSLEVLGIKKIEGNIFLDNSYFEDASGKSKISFMTVASFDKAAKGQLNQVVLGKNGKPVKQKIRLKRRSTRKYVSVMPNQYLGNAFVKELNKRKMTKQKFIEQNFDIPDSVSFTRLFQHRSEPLLDILKRTNKNSDNFYADQLIRTLGYELGSGGSLKEGIAVVNRFLIHGVGLSESEFKLSDGSGISHDNHISAQSLTSILNFMANDNYANVYYDSFSIPTVDGTMKNRIKHPMAENIRAKTGSITGVTSLSGYLKSSTGKKLIFSILCNGGRAKRLMNLEDQILKTLLDF